MNPIAQALGPFQWGQGGQKLSPDDVARKRELAQALMSKSATPQNVGQGLNRIGEALLYNSLSGRANEAEQAGIDNANQIFSGIQDGEYSTEDLMAAMSDPYLKQNGGQSAVVQALLNQKIQQQDPMYGLNLERAQLELDALRNPAWQAPDLETIYDPETGREQKVYLTPDGFSPVGGIKAADDPLVTVNTGEGNKFYNELDAANAKIFSTLSEGGVTARSKLNQIERLENLITAAPSGMEAGIKQMLGDFGIETEGLDAIQSARALLEAMVPQQRPVGSGPMSDADVKMFRNSLPRLINQPGGNMLIINTLRGIAEYEMQMGQIADMVANRGLTPAEGRKMLAELPNPLEGVQDTVKPQAETGGGGMESPPASFTGDPGLWQFMSPEDRKLWQ